MITFIFDGVDAFIWLKKVFFQQATILMIQMNIFFSALNIEESLKKVIDTFFPTVTSHQGPVQLSFHRQQDNNLASLEFEF